MSFDYNEQLGTLDIYGYNLAKSQKFRNIATNNTVAFVVDDIFSHDPWRVRCLEIRGSAQQAENAEGEPLIRITPKRIISFGIATPRPKRTTWCSTAATCRRPRVSVAAGRPGPPRRRLR